MVITRTLLEVMIYILNLTTFIYNWLLIKTTLLHRGKTEKANKEANKETKGTPQRRRSSHKQPNPGGEKKRPKFSEQCLVFLLQKASRASVTSL